MSENSNQTQHEKIQLFIQELSGFAGTAESTLEKIDQDKEKNRDQFSVFSRKMFDIRGTAQQLELPHIAKIAGLGEEIALKAAKATRNAQIRKCMGALWDALTTVKYLLQHYQEPTTDEQEILVTRLEATLKALGGEREKVDAKAIEELLKSRRGAS